MLTEKIAKAIDRLQAFEPEEGYYLCFSGGKDSQAIYHIAKEAGIKFDAHYNITGIDPPEVVYFMRKQYPDVIMHPFKKSMFELIEKKGLPTRWARFCCSDLKERGGEGRICVTGVRWAESKKRQGRTPFEVFTNKKEDKKLFNDNDYERMMFENCMQKGKRLVNPIIDWTDEEVWQYLNSRNIPHCELYDQGFNRIGCVGCPLVSKRIRLEQFKRYPKFYDNYKRAAEKYLAGYLKRRQAKGETPKFTDIEEIMDWWINKIGN